MAAMLLQTLPAPNLERWVHVGSTSQGDSAIDPQSITRTGDLATVVVRTSIHRSQTTGGPVVGVMRYAFNCRTRRGRLEVADLYRGDGTFVGSTVNEDPEEPVARRSPDGEALELACRPSGQR